MKKSFEQISQIKIREVGPIKRDRNNFSDLIKVNDDGLVSARGLHQFLEVGRDFTTWIKGRISKYDFGENTDFSIVWNDTKTGDVVDYNGNSNSMVKLGYECDYAITIDMAKELSMVENNEKGRQARKYFIQVEKAWNSPEMIMKRALEFANKQVENLKLENAQKNQIIGELKPKADYTDFILNNPGLVTITQISKDYGMSGQELNNTLHKLGVQYKQSEQWLLYSRHHGKGYTHSETIPITRSNGKNDVKMNTKWTQKGRLFIYELLKEKGVLPMIERECL